MGQIAVSQIHMFVYEALKKNHHFYELMAKWSSDEISTGLIHWSSNNARYSDDSFEIVDNDQTVSVSVYVPIRTSTLTANSLESASIQHFNHAPVISFQGTRFRRSDFSTDLNGLGVGIDKYFRFEAKIKRLIHKVYSQYGQVVLTGFSLGGCYAQYAALRNSKFVLELVTFQSPPINIYFHSLLNNSASPHNQMTSMELKKLKDNTKHYLVKNDPLVSAARVHSTADTYSPGYVLTLDFGFWMTQGWSHTIQIFSFFATHLRNRVTHIRPINLDNCCSFMLNGAFDFESDDYPLPRKRLVGMEYAEIELSTKPLEEAILTFERHAVNEVLDPLRLLHIRPITITYEMLTPGYMDYYYMVLWNTYTLHVLNPENYTFPQLLSFQAPILVNSFNEFNFLHPRRFLPNEVKRRFSANLRLFRRKTVLSNPPPAPYTSLMDGNGNVTNAGIHILRGKFLIIDSATSSRADAYSDDEIRYIYNGIYDSNADYNQFRISDGVLLSSHKQSKWRELLVHSEIASYFRMQQFSVRHNTTSIEILRTPEYSRPIYMITRRHLRTIVSILPELFQRFSRENIHFPEIVFNSLRHEDVYAFLKNGINLNPGSNSFLEMAYFRAHCFYIGETFKDPLGLLADDQLLDLLNQSTNNEQRSRDFRSDDLTEFNMSNFRYYAHQGMSSTIGESERDGLLKSFNASRVAEWYSFLFNGRSPSYRTNGFLARSYDVEPAPLGRNSRNTNSLFDPQKINGGKNILNKEPDICMIYVMDRRFEIIDPTFRFNIPWHNFKTAVYMAVFKEIFPDETVNVSLNWEFSGLDHRDKRLQIFV